MLCPQLSFIPMHESYREMSYFPTARLSIIPPIEDIWDKWKPRIYSGQNTCSQIQSPNMSQSLARLPIFFCLENSYSLEFSSSISPNHYHVLEHPVLYFNSLYLAISQQYELILYFLSLSLDCECLKISDCMVRRSKNRTRLS